MSRREIFSRRKFEFFAGDSLFYFGEETKIMGVINVTPDSFSDGGKYLDPGFAQAQAVKMRDDGAHFLDIGGESSRPGSSPISWREEHRRVIPALKRIRRRVNLPISIDTYKYEVAQAALDEGASIINDIYGLRSDKKMAKLIAKKNASVILMHMLGTPRTMQEKPVYKHLITDVKKGLKKSILLALDAGISPKRIMIDPGFGFGKTAENNFEMLSELDQFAGLGYPVLAGISKKSFIGKILSLPVGERLYASIAAAVYAVARGAHVVRAHDVLAHNQACAVIDHLMGLKKQD